MTIIADLDRQARQAPWQYDTGSGTIMSPTGEVGFVGPDNLDGHLIVALRNHIAPDTAEATVERAVVEGEERTLTALPEDPTERAALLERTLVWLRSNLPGGFGPSPDWAWAVAFAPDEMRNVLVELVRSGGNGE